MPSKEPGPTIQEAVERHIPDNMRRLGDPFLVLFEGSYHLVTYIPHRPSATQWLIREMEAFRLPPTPRWPAVVICTSCGLGTTVSAPSGWEKTEKGWRCPRCSS